MSRVNERWVSYLRLRTSSFRRRIRARPASPLTAHSRADEGSARLADGGGRPSYAATPSEMPYIRIPYVDVEEKSGTKDNIMFAPAFPQSDDELNHMSPSSVDVNAGRSRTLDIIPN
ncbi:hypothetical protein EVAR_88498_1 [Eumeta japonica]|uniref:Uncharacterized protein n=1 Tax=Eumeta variegata TaxID=151549 RepID=A0A4C1XSB9_EUMVA|nr:hypothetical protein EVAR_88498_1 [Eumeta japonica]